MVIDTEVPFPRNEMLGSLDSCDKPLPFICQKAPLKPFEGLQLGKYCFTLKRKPEFTQESQTEFTQDSQSEFKTDSQPEFTPNSQPGFTTDRPLDFKPGSQPKFSAVS